MEFRIVAIWIERNIWNFMELQVYILAVKTLFI